MSILDLLKSKIDSRLIPERSLTDKKAFAKRIAATLERDYLPFSFLRVCNYDFKTCSMAAYLPVKELYKSTDGNREREGEIIRYLGLISFDSDSPIVGPGYLPVRFCTTVNYDLIFSINRCAFSSPDSIIGIKGIGCVPSFLNGQKGALYRILKGMKFITIKDDWTFFKLDPETTDDMTAMIALQVEKNFEIEFAHFPHDSGPVTLFRWIDS